MFPEQRRTIGLNYLQEVQIHGFTNALPEPRGEQERTSPEGKAWTLQTILQDTARDFATQIRAVLRDDTLTEKGQNQKIGELAKKTLGKIDKVASQGTLDVVDTELDRLRTLLTTSKGKKAAGDIETLLLQREVRDRLLSMPDTERMSAFWMAIDAGDTLTVESVLSAPRIRPIVPDEELSRGRQVWFEKQNPEVADRVAELEQVRDTVASNLTHVRQSIEGVALIERPAEITYRDPESGEWVTRPLVEERGGDGKTGEGDNQS